MHIVAFIANHGSTIKNCMVYNADFCKLTDRETSSVNTLKSGSNSIMISNGNLIIESDYGFGYISNMGGSKIAGLNGEKVINVSHLSKGIYIVVIDNVSYKIVL